MPFPKSPPIVYKKNLLNRVICQVRFPRILLIDSKAPAEFQEKLRKDYPFFEERPTEQFPAEIASLLPEKIANVLANSNRKAYDFISRDKRWVVALTSEFMALTSHDYDHWTPFVQRFRSLLDALVDVYDPRLLSRIGLRYINVIRRSSLDLDGVPWSDLLNHHIAGLLAWDGVEENNIPEDVHSTTILLQDGSSKVRMRYGLVKNENYDEVGYQIDNDFFIEGEMEVSDAIEKLNYFNRRAGRVFNWSISEPLRQALGSTETGQRDDEP